MATFDQAAVSTLFNNVVSHAKKLGIFTGVNTHEPKAAPGSGMTYDIWVQSMEPIASASGLASTSGYVVLTGRIYLNMLQKPEDDADKMILTAASTMIGEYSGDFDFGETVRNVDLLGMYGQKLMATGGYVTINSTVYRIMTLTIPVVVNDMWSQVALCGC
jgi:hypothetical protein